MSTMIIHSGKHLTNGKTSVVFSINGNKIPANDQELPVPEIFLTSLQDMAVHFAIAFGLARLEDYTVETGEDKVPRPSFKNPGFAKLFAMTGFSVDKKGMLTLTCTWHGGHTATTVNIGNINTSFESNNGYAYLVDLNELLACFRHQCTKYVERLLEGETKLMKKPEPVKKTEPEFKFGQDKEKDVTDLYVGKDKPDIIEDGDPLGVDQNADNSETEPLENFQKGTVRTMDQSKPTPLRGGRKGGQQTPGNPSGS